MSQCCIRCVFFRFFELFEKYGGYKSGKLKLKKPKQLQVSPSISSLPVTQEPAVCSSVEGNSIYDNMVVLYMASTSNPVFQCFFHLEVFPGHCCLRLLFVVVKALVAVKHFDKLV